MQDITKIARELCELLDQQMRVLSRRGFHRMTIEEVIDYDRRRERIAELRSGLDETG